MTEKEYELLYIIPNKYTDEEVVPIMTKIDDMIKKLAMTLVKTENQGKRKLAYVIKQFNHGYYILSEFKGSTESINELSNQLTLMPEVLRHSLTYKVDTGLDSAKRAKLAMEMEAGAMEKTDTVEYKAKPATPAPAAGKYVPNIAKEIGAIGSETTENPTLNEPAPAGEKLDVKELDNKLDELLKDL